MQTNQRAAGMDSTKTIALDDLYPIKDLVALNPKILNLTLLRWQLRHRRENGLAVACVPVGNRILISKSRYEQWLATQAESEQLVEGCTR